jgi:hypothetical protein
MWPVFIPSQILLDEYQRWKSCLPKTIFFWKQQFTDLRNYLTIFAINEILFLQVAVPFFCTKSSAIASLFEKWLCYAGFVVLIAVVMNSSLFWSAVCYLLHAGFLLGLYFDPENGGNMFLRNVGCLSTDCTALYPRRQIVRGYYNSDIWHFS